jgi:hypothetical protein
MSKKLRRKRNIYDKRILDIEEIILKVKEKFPEATDAQVVDAYRWEKELYNVKYVISFTLSIDGIMIYYDIIPDKQEIISVDPHPQIDVSLCKESKYNNQAREITKMFNLKKVKNILIKDIFRDIIIQR